MLVMPITQDVVCNTGPRPPASGRPQVSFQQPPVASNAQLRPPAYPAANTNPQTRAQQPGNFQVQNGSPTKGCTYTHAQLPKSPWSPDGWPKVLILSLWRSPGGARRAWEQCVWRRRARKPGCLGTSQPRAGSRRGCAQFCCSCLQLPAGTSVMLSRHFAHEAWPEPAVLVCPIQSIGEHFHAACLKSAEWSAGQETDRSNV